LLAYAILVHAKETVYEYTRMDVNGEF